jgi:hypothetical protein
MSALLLKADVCGADRHVAFGQTRTFVQSVEALPFDLLPIGKYMPVKIASPTNNTRTTISVELSPL